MKIKKSKFANFFYRYAKVYNNDVREFILPTLSHCRISIILVTFRKTLLQRKWILKSWCKSDTESCYADDVIGKTGKFFKKLAFICIMHIYVFMNKYILIKKKICSKKCGDVSVCNILLSWKMSIILVTFKNTGAKKIKTKDTDLNLILIELMLMM